MRIRKVKLYGVPGSTQPQSQSPAGDLRNVTVVEGRRRTGKVGRFSHSDRVPGKLFKHDVLLDTKWLRPDIWAHGRKQ